VRIVTSPDAPAPVAGAPYSPCVVAGPGELVFVSGQLGIDVATGALVEGGVGPQARKALENLSALLHAADSAASDLVSVTLYLTDLTEDFAEVNAAYGDVLGEARPARATVGVAALPLGARIEVQAIAMRSEG
jgi:2-iminobutanoate/2-iminopropanoate deaminase